MNTNINAKRILLYGDSLVYGKASGVNQRLDIKTRFSGILQNELGQDYEVIEEGLRARMLVGENGFFPNRNGLEQFYAIAGSHFPLNLVVLILGTNDCNSQAVFDENSFTQAFKQYKAVIEEWSDFLALPMPELLIVAPPPINEAKYDEGSQKIFSSGASIKVARLPEIYRKISQQIGASFVSLHDVCQPANGDGIHLDKEANKQVASVLSKEVVRILE